MSKLFIAFSLLVSLVSCGPKYKIHGESSLARLDSKKLFLKAFRNGEMVAIDSAEVVHGVFTMKGKLDSVEMVMLYMDEITIMPLVLEKGHIRIKLDNTQIIAKGTILNDRLYSFFANKITLEERMEELERREARLIMDGENFEEVRRNFMQENENLNNEMITLVKEFICDNYENVLGPGIFRMINDPYPMITGFMEDIFKNAPECFKNHYLVKECVAFAKDNSTVSNTLEN